jgi:hypothetical protein
MIWTNAIKKPMLLLGVILFTLFLGQETTSRWWSQYRDRFIPNTCKALKDKLGPQLTDWSFDCPDPNLLKISIPFNHSFVSEDQRKYMYRTLANSIVLLSQKSNEETLETLKECEISLVSQKLTLFGFVKGSDIVKFKKLTSQNEILTHLQGTVTVRESTAVLSQ